MKLINKKEVELVVGGVVKQADKEPEAWIVENAAGHGKLVKKVAIEIFQ